MIARASYGMTLKVQDEHSREESVFYLVRAEEENWQENKISMYHPLGKALFSKAVNDVVQVILDDGTSKKFRILAIDPT